MPARPEIRTLCLHTGGALWLDAVGAIGVRQGSLLAWMAGSPRLELSEGVESALLELGAGTLDDGRSVSSYWLKLSQGALPLGRSADLVIAAGVLARRLADQLAGDIAPPSSAPKADRPTWVITGSGRVVLSGDGYGVPVATAVDGWAEKLQQLASALRGLCSPRVLLLHPAEQGAELRSAVAALGLDVQPVAIGSPSELRAALLTSFGVTPLVQPESWPDPSADAAEVLQRAEALARRQAVGFLGIEHIALALLERAPRGPWSHRVGAALSAESLRLVAWSAPETGSLDPTLTPRLLAWIQQLPAGFDLEALAKAICRDPHHALHAVASQPIDPPTQVAGQTHGTLPSQGWAHDTEAPVVALSVLRGPEDGRILALQEGYTIGRWAPDNAPTHALYASSALRDRALSRQHLRWSEGRLVSAQPVRIARADGLEAVPAGEAVALAAGDLVQVTPATWLRALA